MLVAFMLTGHIDVSVDFRMMVPHSVLGSLCVGMLVFGLLDGRFQHGPCVPEAVTDF